METCTYNLAVVVLEAGFVRSGKIVRRLLEAQALGEDPGDLSALAG